MVIVELEDRRAPPISQMLHRCVKDFHFASCLDILQPGVGVIPSEDFIKGAVHKFAICDVPDERTGDVDLVPQLIRKLDI